MFSGDIERDQWLQTKISFFDPKKNWANVGTHVNLLRVTSSKMIAVREYIKENMGPGIKNIWDKIFQNGPSEICGRQLLKNF